MVGPGELVVLGTSAPLALKVLGPTADYVGNELQNWTERRVENVQRIFEKAEQRLGDRINEPGRVPPRVLREVLEDGSYFDDELGAEYFGGLLAASRDEAPLDDRAAALAALVGRLSTYQVRAHYVLYHTARELLVETDINVAIGGQLEERGAIFVPSEVMLPALGAKEDSSDFDWHSVFQHVLSGLNREGLIGKKFSWGNRPFLEHRYQLKFPSGGITFRPSLFGIELFCSAHGLSKPLTTFKDPAIRFEMEMELPLEEGSQLLRELPSWTPA